MAKVMHVWQTQHLGKLLAQSDLHFVFGEIDAVLGQTAGLNVTIQDDDFMPALGDFLCGKHARRTCANHKNGFHVVSSTRSPQRTCSIEIQAVLYFWPS